MPFLKKTIEEYNKNKLITTSINGRTDVNELTPDEFIQHLDLSTAVDIKNTNGDYAGEAMAVRTKDKSFEKTIYFYNENSLNTTIILTHINSELVEAVDLNNNNTLRVLTHYDPVDDVTEGSTGGGGGIASEPTSKLFWQFNYLLLPLFRFCFL